MEMKGQVIEAAIVKNRHPDVLMEMNIQSALNYEDSRVKWGIHLKYKNRINRKKFSFYA
jgi:hypothetical protein